MNLFVLDFPTILILLLFQTFCLTLLAFPQFLETVKQQTLGQQLDTVSHTVSCFAFPEKSHSFRFVRDFFETFEFRSFCSKCEEITCKRKKTVLNVFSLKI